MWSSLVIAMQHQLFVLENSEFAIVGKKKLTMPYGNAEVVRFCYWKQFSITENVKFCDDISANHGLFFSMSSMLLFCMQNDVEYVTFYYGQLELARQLTIAKVEFKIIETNNKKLI